MNVRVWAVALATTAIIVAFANRSVKVHSTDIILEEFKKKKIVLLSVRIEEF